MDITPNTWDKQYLVAIIQNWLKNEQRLTLSIFNTVIVQQWLKNELDKTGIYLPVIFFRIPSPLWSKKKSKNANK